MESTTLQFDNARAASALYNNDEKLLREMESRFGVQVAAREGWIRIEGNKENAERAARAFTQLDEARRSGTVIGRQEFRYALQSGEADEHDGNIKDLAAERIICSLRKAPVIPKTAGQRDYVRAIREHDLVFGVGPAGTGKTYLAMAMAVAALKKEQVSRIVLTRPAVEAGEALGFLPGALEEKILPYLRPLYDALYDMLETEEIQKFMDRGIIEIAPLAYMRGRTLNHSFIVLDEAQNTTTEQMFMFLTRLGNESKCVITGDRTQIDLPHNRRSGLLEAIEILKDVKGIDIRLMSQRDVVRHPLVQAVVNAYEQHREAAAPKA
ncbi:MAG: PhoH family protein [Chthoniobacterales bacterium]|jgi:phosphate starvation-inducible protein PhoH and related proteins|nr:PhoH family protein [Chthoniobacterales bacterium]